MNWIKEFAVSLILNDLKILDEASWMTVGDVLRSAEVLELLRNNRGMIENCSACIGTIFLKC